jgi:RNA polymerase sigma-54 factor
MKMKLSNQQVQKQILTPYMQQSIELLLLPIGDLELTVEQELQSNPLLEVDEGPPLEPGMPGKDPLDFKHRLENFLKNQDQSYQAQADYGDDDMLEEKQIKVDQSLEEALLRQLRVEFSDPQELKIGEYIIGNINEDGYLTVSAENIAEALGITDLNLIEQVLETIQHFEPLGIASRDLKECLLIQAKEKSTEDGLMISQIINNYLKELGQKKYTEISRKMGIAVDAVKRVNRFIATLDPKPARNYRPLGMNIYIKPEVFIVQEGEEFQVQLNKESSPVLRINKIYKNLLKKENLKPEEKEFIREKLKQAILFIKGLEQRGNTIKEIAKFILEKQKNFFKEGHVALVPMNLKDVAQAIDRNESTISRAINNKYIDTPQGIYPLKFFFSQAIKAESDSGVVSNRSIKEEIKDLIESEDKSSPLSDQEIEKHFRGKGMAVARRTISKYRQALNILPSHLRKT